MLALCQLGSQLHDLRARRRVHTSFDTRQALRLGRGAPRGQFGIGCQYQGDPVRVVQQQAPGQLPDVVRFLDAAAQPGDHRFQVQHGNGVAVVGGATQRLQYQLQAIGIAIPGDFALVQLQLMQHCFHAVVTHAVSGHLFQYLQHHGFQGVGVFRFAAFDTAAEHHLPHAVLKTAQGGGGLPE